MRDFLADTFSDWNMDRAMASAIAVACSLLNVPGMIAGYWFSYVFFVLCLAIALFAWPVLDRLGGRS